MPDLRALPLRGGADAAVCRGVLNDVLDDVDHALAVAGLARDELHVALTAAGFAAIAHLVGTPLVVAASHAAVGPT